MDSPSALGPGDFNWASTMLHEIAHAFHLAMSDHRVPRWFTEGLAVHEQQKARDRWGFKATPAWLNAYDSGRLHPVSRLNEGFIRPEFPEQVVFSYYQASLVFDLIERDWGMDGILAMLDGYREGRSTEEVFQEVLGQSPEDFDEVFHDFVQERWGDQMAAVSGSGAGHPGVFSPGQGQGQDLNALRRLSVQNPGSFQARLSYGQALFEAQRFEEAETEFQAALSLFPEYGGPNGPYRYLAQIHREKGEDEASARALRRMGELNETLYQVHLDEAGIWEELEDEAAAAEALGKVVEIVPFDDEVHVRLAGFYEEMGDMDGAVRERRAVLALGPTDRADAHYRLAAAMAAAGDRAGARSEVLRALEIAPSFEAALELLLELRGGSGGSPEGDEQGEGEDMKGVPR
jgi:tetratricopeptide (TPR) repeat protein